MIWLLGFLSRSAAPWRSLWCFQGSVKLHTGKRYSLFLAAAASACIGWRRHRAGRGALDSVPVAMAWMLWTLSDRPLDRLLWSVPFRNSHTGFGFIYHFHLARGRYLLFHLHTFLYCALTFGSYFIRYFMLKHIVKNVELKEIKGVLKWPLSIKTCSFLLEFVEAVAFFRGGMSWKVFSPSGKSGKSV